MISLQTLSSCEIKRIIQGIVANYKYPDQTRAEAEHVKWSQLKLAAFTLELCMRSQTTNATIVQMTGLFSDRSSRSHTLHEAKFLLSPRGL